MIQFTREQLQASWASHGTGTPLSEEKIEHMLRVLNEPIRPKEMRFALFDKLRGIAIVCLPGEVRNISITVTIQP